MGNIASVVISNCTREFDKEYHYIIPDKFKNYVKRGSRVIVPFGKSDAPKEAFVINILEKSDRSDLKTIIKAVNEKQILSEMMLNLASWMKKRYICTYYDAIKCMLPAGIGIKAVTIIRLENNNDNKKLEGGNIKKPIEGGTSIEQEAATEHKTTTGEETSTGQKTAMRQEITTEQELTDIEKKIIETIKELGNECEVSELKNKLKNKSNIKAIQKHLKNMENKGLIRISQEYASRVKEKYMRIVYTTLSDEEIADIIESDKLKKIQQIKVLEMLMENDYVSVQDVLRFSGATPAILETLKKRGYINFKQIEVKRNPADNIYHEDFGFPELSEEQIDAIRILKNKIDEGEFSEFLLHGITGSGKTEVYLQLIQYVIDRGKEAIVLVPEISLTPQMTVRFKTRFGNNIALLHSRLSPGERYDQWRLIREKKVKVAIGARSAVFAPFENIGLIVIDEEHEGSYKSETTPKYHATDVARYICKQQNALLVEGSATPSAETYYKAETNEIGIIQMKERPHNMMLPKIELIDMREELKKGNRSIFSTRLSEEIQKNIEMSRQTILLLNRRGYSTFVLCRNCGYVAKCANCSISLTYHALYDRLTCHYCGYTIKAPKVCPMCKSSYIKHFGLGTQKLEEEVKKQFNGCTVIRMDSDTTSFKNSHAAILNKFREENINILVGTQMVAKGHDFPNVTLVGVLAADSILNIAEYKAPEKTFQLLTQVAGRAGRGNEPGRVIIQSYNTENYSILAACNHDYTSFYNQEKLLRKEMNYPPFTNIAVAILSGSNDKKVMENSNFVKDIIFQYFKDEAKDKNMVGDPYEILGPMKPPIARLKNKYRWRIVIKCSDLEVLLNVLTKTSDDFNRIKGNDSSVQLSIDINPVSML